MVVYSWELRSHDIYMLRPHSSAHIVCAAGIKSKDKALGDGLKGFRVGNLASPDNDFITTVICY